LRQKKKERRGHSKCQEIAEIIIRRIIKVKKKIERRKKKNTVGTKRRNLKKVYLLYAASKPTNIEAEHKHASA
jgi:hypothetical protein